MPDRLTPNPAIQKSLRVAWKEGIPAAIMIGIMDYYVVPFGLFLHASTQQIGWLVALPHLLGAASLLFTVKAVNLIGSRLRFIVRGTFLQASLLIPVASLALIRIPNQVTGLILFIIFYRMLFNLVGPPWGSLMSDYLPAHQRGRYFGSRSRVVGASQVAGIILAGVTLFLTQPNPAVAPRPKAVCDTAVSSRWVGGCRPIGTELPVPQAHPVGLLPAIGPTAEGMGPVRLLQRTGGRDVAPLEAALSVPQAHPVGLHTPAVGFFLIFMFAASGRFLSSHYLTQMVDLPSRQTPQSDFTFLMFIRRFRESNFVKFAFYVSSVLFTTFLAAPYFSVYMLRDLQFSYLSYMAIHVSGMTASFLAFPVWGRHADVVGNAKVLKTTGLLIPMIPFLWLIGRYPLYLMMVEMLSGFIWGGFNLSATNFIYDAVSSEKRVRCLGYFNLINGVAMFAGAACGGWLGDRLPPLLGFRLLSLIMLSGLLRLLAHGTLACVFREVRATSRRISSMQLFFSVVGIRPLAGEARESIFGDWTKRPGCST